MCILDRVKSGHAAGAIQGRRPCRNHNWLDMMKNVFQAHVADASGIPRRPDRSCACSGSSCSCWTGGWLLDREVAPAPMKAVAFQSIRDADPRAFYGCRTRLAAASGCQDTKSAYSCVLLAMRLMSPPKNRLTPSLKEARPISIIDDQTKQSRLSCLRNAGSFDPAISSSPSGRVRSHAPCLQHHPPYPT